MNDDFEQFPPIEGNDSDPLGALAVIVSAAFAIGMIIYVLIQ
jgi:hypothetical protein